MTFNEGRDYHINKRVPKDTAPGLRTGRLLLLLKLYIGLAIMVFCQETKAKPRVARKPDHPQAGSWMEVVSLRTALVLLVIAISSCAGANSASKSSDPITVDLSRVRFSGGDGRDCNNRILIIGAINEPVGIQAERFWLNKHFPGFKNTHQELFRCDGKPVDWITIQTADGKTREVVFDVSEFVGK